MDEKLENEKHRAASDEHRREQKNDMRFHQMMQFQAQQTNAMLKMMAMVMNPAITPEQLSVFEVKAPDLAIQEIPATVTSQVLQPASTFNALPSVPSQAVQSCRSV